MSRDTRHLVVVFGDQLDPDAAAFDGFDAGQDRVWMAEVRGEGAKVWSHRQRIALFLAGMRHYRDEARARGRRVDYQALDDPDNTGSLMGELERALERWKPAAVVAVEPGEYGVEADLRGLCARVGIPLDLRVDRHFFCSREAFGQWARGRKQTVMEAFYREMRRLHGVLLEADGRTPAGGAWNYDAENRAAFGREGPGEVPPPVEFPPDERTREVLRLVEREFPGYPGSLEGFGWAVNRVQAREALEDFLEHRLAGFGQHQDAMWAGQPTLWHSRLAAALNLKLLDPREVVAGAEARWRAGRAPLAAVEGLVRQILGWREYVRGQYWRHMPAYLEWNALGAEEPLPGFFWTGDTPLACLRETIVDTLRYGYAHHIQRLMVTGLYALLLGVRPREVEDWYLAVYVDAVEWVTLPNVLGMSQYADGGRMASKPYVATGKYIERMSNYCQRCPQRPGVALGPCACPFTTLYWDFLERHEERLKSNPRMALQLKNLARWSGEERAAIRRQAESIRRRPEGKERGEAGPGENELLRGLV